MSRMYKLDPVPQISHTSPYLSCDLSPKGCLERSNLCRQSGYRCLRATAGCCCRRGRRCLVLRSWRIARGAVLWSRRRHRQFVRPAALRSVGAKVPVAGVRGWYRVRWRGSLGTPEAAHCGRLATTARCGASCEHGRGHRATCLHRGRRRRNNQVAVGIVQAKRDAAGREDVNERVSRLYEPASRKNWSRIHNASKGQRANDKARR